MTRRAAVPDRQTPPPQASRKKVRPRVHEAEKDNALARILDIRQTVEDTRFTDTVDGENPDLVLTYITTHPLSTRHYPQLAEAELLDGQVLSNWMWWVGVRRDHALVKLLRRAGTGWGTIGEQFGLGREGIRARFEIWTALLAHDRPDLGLTRENRRVDRLVTGRADPRAAWFASHSDHIATVVQNVVRRCSPYCTEEITSDLDEIVADMDNDRSWTQGGMVFLGLAVQALRVRPEITELAPQHLAQRALRSASLLAEAFAALSDPPGEEDQ